MAAQTRRSADAVTRHAPRPLALQARKSIRHRPAIGPSLASVVGLFRGVPYSFGALRKTFGPLWVRCDVCRRYAWLLLRDLRDVDYRTKTFSCSICGADGAMALEEPCKDTGMEDYRLDQRVDPKHHPTAVRRMTERERRSYRHGGGELQDLARARQVARYEPLTALANDLGPETDRVLSLCHLLPP